MIQAMHKDVLLIDDTPTNLEMMSYLLSAFGYSVRVARSGAQGLDMAHQASPDLIICDILMPGIDGYEVARQLSADPVLVAIPLVAVTALAMAEDRARILDSGFDGYISKPIDPETFVSEVGMFLRT
jgi:CheY-like chemotaxis protein